MYFRNNQRWNYNIRFSQKKQIVFALAKDVNINSESSLLSFIFSISTNTMFVRCSQSSNTLHWITYQLAGSNILESSIVNRN